MKVSGVISLMHSLKRFRCALLSQVVHEEGWAGQQLCRRQRRALLLGWAGARRAFLLRAGASAARAAAAQQEAAALAGPRLRQRQRCAALKAKVRSLTHLPVLLCWLYPYIQVQVAVLK